MKKHLFFSILIATGISSTGCFNDIPGEVSIQSMRSLTVAELPGEVTDYEFFNLFSETMDTALGKISLMQNSGMDMLGEEIQAGDISGTVHYKATFNFWRMRATVVITFDNYCDTLIEDEELMILDDAITTISNINGNGDLTGTINVTGLYPGYVRHDLIITSQQPNGGNYYVRQEGSNDETAIPWDYMPE